MEIQIIDQDAAGGRGLYEVVRKSVAETPGELTFELRGSEDSYRDPSIDPTILVALVSGVNSFLTALIVGLLKIVEARKPAGVIVIETRGGKKIQFPAGTPRSEIEFLLEKAEGLEVERVRLVSGDADARLITERGGYR